jgi:hypothetical protein
MVELEIFLPAFFSKSAILVGRSNIISPKMTACSLLSIQSFYGNLALKVAAVW